MSGFFYSSPNPSGILPRGFFIWANIYLGAHANQDVYTSNSIIIHIFWKGVGRDWKSTEF